MQRMNLLASLVVCAALSIQPAAADTPAEIQSQAQLEAYLAANAATSPLAALSPGARERFVMSLSFNESGITSLDASDLMDELTQEQILAVLALFGPRALEHPPPSHYLETRAVEKRVAHPKEIGAIERRYNEFYGDTRHLARGTDLARAREIAAAFDARLAGLFAPAALRRADDHELRLLRAAVRRVAMQTSQAKYLDAFRAVFAERVRRNLVSSDDIATLQGLLLAQHRIGDARRIAYDYPNAKLAQLPQFRDSLAPGNTAPTVWRVDPAGRQLTRAAIDLAPPTIIVTANCQFAKEAAADISADALLGPLFERHALWLVPAPGIEAVSDARDWNRKFPRAPVAMIYDRAEWSFLPDWQLPQFYIVRDGRVVDSVNGWWRGSAQSRDQLITALRRNGLLTETQ